MNDLEGCNPEGVGETYVEGECYGGNEIMPGWMITEEGLQNLLDVEVETFYHPIPFRVVWSRDVVVTLKQSKSILECRC